MDHQEIQRTDLIDRYLADRLTEEEASRFEEHLLECPACLEQVRWTEDFRDAVHAAAAREQSAQAQAAAAAVEAGVLAWLARRSLSHRRAFLLAAGFFVAALPAWLLWRQGGLERELAVAQAAVAQAERQVREVESRTPRPAPANAAATPPATAKPAANILDTERQRLEAELRREREASARLQEQVQRLSRPQPAALVMLGFVRSGPAEGQTIHGGEGGVVLSVELPVGAEPAYRATLREAGGKVLWREDRLATGSDETLLISFPSGFLRPGSYRLQLESLAEEGGGAPAGELPFQILAD
jgi:hypothetical protein